jgi:hypothetical protein
METRPALRQSSAFRRRISDMPSRVGSPRMVVSNDDERYLWMLSLKRLLEIVNGLLEEAGSAERLYAIYGGNDGRVILLTPEMQDYIESIGDVLDDGWMPRRVEQIEAGD